MHLDDALHRLEVRKPDIVKEAAAQERVRQFLFIVRGDDDDGAVPRPHRLAGLVDVELHPVELGQKVVRKLDVGLVDLVDQEDDLLVRLERLPQLAAADVVADVVNPRVAELAVAQPADRVVLVEPLDRLGRRLHVPFEQRQTEAEGDLARQLGLAGAGLALDQKRPLERHRGIDRDGKIAGCHIGVGTGETICHGCALSPPDRQDRSASRRPQRHPESREIRGVTVRGERSKASRQGGGRMSDDLEETGWCEVEGSSDEGRELSAGRLPSRR